MVVRRLASCAATIAIGFVALGYSYIVRPLDRATPALAALPQLGPCPPVAPGAHEKYRLPRTGSLQPGVSFASDWTQNPTGGWFGVQAMDSCRMRRDGTLTWHGKAAVRVEVQPNDDPLALKGNSERAEVLIMQDAKGGQIKETAASGVQYYATSYYFPADWAGQQLPWSAFRAVNCAGGGQDQCNSWSIVWQFYGWGGMSAAQMAPGGPQRYRFNNAEFTMRGDVALGKWTDFVFVVDWRTGGYSVWRRDEGEKQFALVLTDKTRLKPGVQVYVKQGLYRGAAHGGRTDVLWIGPTARGASFAAVERQAFATEEGGE